MQKTISIETRKKYELVDITHQIKEIVKQAKVKGGFCQVYVPHATAAIIINENYDPDICDDFLDSLNDLIPEGKWRHDRVDGNGAAHIKAAILGPSETIPIQNGNLLLGQWQACMFCELDGPRQRKIIITVVSK